MKKTFTMPEGKIRTAAVCILLAASILILATACGAAETPADGAGPQGTAPESTGPESAAPESAVSLEEAKSIAVNDAGLRESDVTFTRAKLERDDSRTEYEIDFHTADREYDYEIDAVTGEILDRDSEPLDSQDD